MKFAIYGKQLAEPALPLLQNLIDVLQEADGPLFIFEPMFRSVGYNLKFREKPYLFNTRADLQGRVDILFSAGGDGTMLDAVEMVGDSGILLAGINVGRLGFLTSVSRDQIGKAVQAVMASDFWLDRRTLLKLEKPEGLFGEGKFALNELTVYKAKPMSMLTIQTWVNGDFLNSYWADGLIVATPTGSTAYSLSCTGPIIAPDAGTIVITPIASHNLTVRPIVLRDDVEIKILVGGEDTCFFVSMDSRIKEVRNPVELIIRKASFEISLLRLKGSTFFNTLRDKLNWGLDVRN
jgi:NAD+ kinase